MSTELDLSYIREIYGRMSDGELTYIVTQDASGLSVDVRQVIKEELEKRGIDTGILVGFDAQNRDYTTEEIDKYCELLRTLYCPKCGSHAHTLNGSVTYTTMSFIIFTNYEKKLIVACPSCLDSGNNKAQLITFFLGWWGFPWGPIRSVQSLINNFRSRRAHNDSGPNFYLRSFAAYKVGMIEAFKNNKEKLQQVISSGSVN